MVAYESRYGALPPVAVRLTPPVRVNPATVEFPGRIPGTPSMRVVWEALAVETERLQESKWKRPTEGLPISQKDVDLEIVLLNASFQATPEQAAENRGDKAVGRVARITDQDMLDLVEALDRIGFFRYAQPTESVRPLFPTDRARGRITVERDGQSVTLLSQRFLGLRPETRPIPWIYTQAKEAIMVIKNRTPVLRVKSIDVEGQARPVESGSPPAKPGAAPGGPGR